MLCQMDLDSPLESTLPEGLSVYCKHSLLNLYSHRPTVLCINLIYTKKKMKVMSFCNSPNGFKLIQRSAPLGLIWSVPCGHLTRAQLGVSLPVVPDCRPGVSLIIQLGEINRGSRDKMTKTSKHREAVTDSIVNSRRVSNNSGHLLSVILPP